MATHTDEDSMLTALHPGAVVVGLDGSEHSERALDWAAHEAMYQHRPLVLLHSAAVVQMRQAVGLAPMGFGVDPNLAVQAVHDAARAFLDDAVHRCRSRWPSLDVRGRLSLLDPREALVDASHTAALVVVGSRGRGAITSLLGSVSVYVSKRSHCPVVVCRPSPAGRARQGVLVGVDGTQENAPAVEQAFRLASERGCDVTAIHSVYEVGDVSQALEEHENEAARVIAESVAGLAEKYPDVRVHRTVAIGLVDNTLVGAAADFELLVVGRPAPSGHHPFHFSTAIAVLERSRTTTVVVPETAKTTTGLR